MIFEYKKIDLAFKFDAGTSRGVLRTKPSYIVFLKKEKIIGTGEVSLIPGLSPDYTADVENVIKGCGYKVSQSQLPKSIFEIDNLLDTCVPITYPAVRFGFETALLDLLNGGEKTFYNNRFTENTEGIPINGLIWMGDEHFMLQQIEEKLKQGFTCLKMKIGSIDYESELGILTKVRNKHPSLTLRVDANGAFDGSNVREVLKDLKKLNIHSIEQPIKVGQIDLMSTLCKESISPIALDEELIGVYNSNEQRNLLKEISPQYIILKPSLLGGLQKTSVWIALASELNVKWWITSALEGNIGLNAIAQYTSQIGCIGHQGLGTGSLFVNNILSPLAIKGEFLWHDNRNKWGKL